MYRQYEDPYKLEEELRLLRVKKDRLMEIGAYDDEAAEDFAQREAELEERINFAWQDEEYDSNCRMDEYPHDYDESFRFD